MTALRLHIGSGADGAIHGFGLVFPVTDGSLRVARYPLRASQAGGRARIAACGYQPGGFLIMRKVSLPVWCSRSRFRPTWSGFHAFPVCRQISGFARCRRPARFASASLPGGDLPNADMSIVDDMAPGEICPVER